MQANVTRISIFNILFNPLCSQFAYSCDTLRGIKAWFIIYIHQNAVSRGFSVCCACRSVAIAKAERKRANCRVLCCSFRRLLHQQLYVSCCGDSTSCDMREKSYTRLQTTTSTEKFNRQSWNACERRPNSILNAVLHFRLSFDRQKRFGFARYNSLLCVSWNTENCLFLFRPQVHLLFPSTMKCGFTLKLKATSAHRKREVQFNSQIFYYTIAAAEFCGIFKK